MHQFRGLTPFITFAEQLLNNDPPTLHQQPKQEQNDEYHDSIGLPTLIGEPAANVRLNPRKYRHSQAPLKSLRRSLSYWSQPALTIVRFDAERIAPPD